MQDRKSAIIITVVVSLLLIAIFATIHFVQKTNDRSRDQITVGFVYDGDESAPYTANFIKAQKAIERKYGKSVKVIVKNNIHDTDGGDKAIMELINEGCDLIFTTSYGYGESAKYYAGKYPDIQFCQATHVNANEDPVYDNYHTFMGEIYQGRYITGVVAGMKLKEMIEDGEITADEAKVGYIGAYPYAEVISGYTAFFLGVRSVVPEVTMEVMYANTWSSFSIEKKCAEELLDRGCVIISQHSDTTGPVLACDEMYAQKKVYNVGYNQSTIDIAPTTSLISSRINWAPYMLGAVEAVLANKKIESCIEGPVHGNDIGAGLEENWVEILELNSHIAAPGSREKIEELIEDFKKGRIDVYKGSYIGVNPENENDTIDLRQGYEENADCSAPTFSYVLKGVITIVE